MLQGIRILDLTDESGFLAGKALGDMGADVIKLEPPAGDPARRAPYLGEIEDPERSLLWLAMNTSKRGITLDLGHARGAELFGELVAGADVVLETSRPGELDERGIGWESLHAAHPRLVWCSITPFGRTGPYATYRGGDLVCVAMGGNQQVTGWHDRAPIACSMPTAYYHGGPEAALGVAMALFARLSTGRGQLVDVSLQETQLQTSLSGPAQYALDPSRNAERRRPGDRMGLSREIWKTADGYVSYGLRGGASRIPNLVALTKWMVECGEAPDWLRDYDWSRYNHNLLDREGFRPFEEAFGAFFEKRSMRELYANAVERRFFLAPCNDAREIAEHVQLRSRDFFTTVEYDWLDLALEHPRGFAHASEDGIGIRRRAPRIGEHDGEVYGELGVAAERLASLRREGVVRDADA
ncbi:MAG: CoA transferase [Myxococcota bacterium]|nr:CoA transferase [Myxococcota bacterium]